MQWIKEHWLECVVSLILTVLAGAFITLQFTYVCDTNDDILLRSIVSGEYTGTPDAHLVYIMYPLGLFLKLLYEMAPNVPWYDGFMIGVHYICWFLVAARIGSRFEKKLSKIVAISLSYAAIVLIDLKYLVLHQYTVLAAVVGVVALLWIVTERNETVKTFIFDHLVTIIMLTICLWLRKQVLFMLLPFIGIAVILRILKADKEQRKKCFLQYAVAIAVLAGIAGASFGVEKIAYSSPEWQAYMDYNAVRTDVYDFYQTPPYDFYQDAYASLGFNEYDAVILGTYNIALLPEADTEKLETLVGLAEEYRIWQEQYYSVYRKTLFSLLESVLYNSVQPISTVLIAGYAVMLLISYIKDRKKDFLAICMVGLYQCLFVAYFLYQNRFPERVSYGFYLMQLVFLLGIGLQNFKQKMVKEETKKQYFWTLVIGCLFVAVGLNVGMYCYKTTLDYNRERVAEAQEWEYLKQYCLQHPEQQFFMKTNAVGAYCETMFSDETCATDNMHYLGTWLLCSPLYAARLQNAGVGDCGTYLAENENGRMLQLGNEDTEWLTLFYRERGYQGSIEITDSIMLPDGTGMSVLQMRED